MVIYCTTLEDAYYFLSQVKHSPSIKSVQVSWQRQLRACILFSWIALEEVLDGAVKRLRKTGTLREPVANSLAGRLRQVLQTKGVDHQQGADFKRLRKLRNEIVHPKETDVSEETPLTVQQAEGTFHFCLGLMRAIYYVPVHVRGLLD